jgi:hypothetical protein
MPSGESYSSGYVIKKHGRKAKSIFRYGLDHLCRVLLNLEERETELLQALQLLSSTY